MPTDKEFVHVQIPGLCVGGGGVNINNQECGHLLLMRDTPGASEMKFKWYHKNILIPGIKAQRKHFGNFDSAPGEPIPDELTAVSWCDGDLSQIKAITDMADELTANKIVANKQHAARSAVEQPADLANVFNVIKSSMPLYTVSDSPPESCPMKKMISDAFKSGELSFIKMAENKKRALIDFLSVIPTIATKACTVDNIRRGFITAGIIDDKRKRYPVFNRILSTCRRDVQVTEYKCIVDNFHRIINEACEKGIVSEEVFEEIGIIKDSDSTGNTVLRDAEISQESRQRTKCLTHAEQVELRMERLALIRQKADNLVELTNAKNQEKLNTVQAIVDKLIVMLESKGLIADMEENLPEEK